MIPLVLHSAVSAVLVHGQSDCDNMRQSNTTDYITSYDNTCIEVSGVNGAAYNCVNNDCANYPGCANKRWSNYPGYTVILAIN